MYTNSKHRSTQKGQIMLLNEAEDNHRYRHHNKIVYDLQFRGLPL